MVEYQVCQLSWGSHVKLSKAYSGAERWAESLHWRDPLHFKEKFEHGRGLPIEIDSLRKGLAIARRLSGAGPKTGQGAGVRMPRAAPCAHRIARIIRPAWKGRAVGLVGDANAWTIRPN